MIEKNETSNGCFQWLKVTKMKANHNFTFKGEKVTVLFPMAQSY